MRRKLEDNLEMEKQTKNMEGFIQWGRKGDVDAQTCRPWKITHQTDLDHTS